MTDLTRRESKLVALGAAMRSNCVPWYRASHSGSPQGRPQRRPPPASLDRCSGAELAVSESGHRAGGGSVSTHRPPPDETTGEPAHRKAARHV
ncbi:MAG: hypothetical protein KGZ83_19385 [Sulfuricella sp.]|nr:hypothetical protein [Sulfuricella sp.]